jgi:DNA-binding IclR family transcriptional regulator
MLIDRETFARSGGEDLQELPSTDHVLGFLAVHDDRAFKAREIARRTELDDGVVSTALSRLKSRDLVEHKGQYWAITADERRLADHAGYARATALFNEQFGEEEREAWQEYVPDEPHPSLTDNET